MKRRAVCSALLLALTVSTTLTSCSASGDDAENKNGGYVIGWSDPSGDQPIFQTFTEALQAAADREHMSIVHLNAAADVSAQASNIQTMINKKVDAIIVFPLAANALTPVLTKAQEAGIKIIGFNAVVQDSASIPTVSAPYDVNLDTGWWEGSQEAGRFVADALDGHGNVVGVKVPVPVPALDALLAGYEQSVTDGNDIQWLGTLPDDTNDLAGAQKSVADAITRYQGDIDAVMSYTDIAGIGASQALSQAGVDNVTIIGQQGNQTGIDALKKDQIQGDIDVQPWMEGAYAVAIARDLFTGKSVPKWVAGPARFLTKSNVDSYVPWPEGVARIKSGQVSLDITFPTDG